MNLVLHPTTKTKYIYLTDPDIPLRFFRGGRAIASVLSRDAGLAERFRAAFGERYRVVREYFADHEQVVTFVDVNTILPPRTPARG